jgi:uncharacterized repeat protein (TIGR02543 family)
MQIMSGSTVPDMDITCYAKWMAHTVRITWYPTNGMPMTQVDLVPGTYFDPPPDPVRSGYDFAGWFAVIDRIETQITGTSIVPNVSTTCTAKWILKAVSIIWVHDDGKSTLSFSDLMPGTQFGTLSVPVRDGWTFHGWFTEPSGGGTQITEKSIVPGVGTIYYAKWAEVINTPFETALPIALNTPVNVSVVASGWKCYYIFTAPTTGTYRFASSENGLCAPYGWLYSYSRTLLAHNGDTVGIRNFTIDYDLVAGQQYYFEASCFFTSAGSYTLTVTRI